MTLTAAWLGIGCVGGMIYILRTLIKYPPISPLSDVLTVLCILMWINLDHRLLQGDGVLDLVTIRQCG